MSISTDDRNTFESDLNSAKEDKDIDAIIDVAKKVAEEGDKEWANKILKQAESMWENDGYRSFDTETLAEALFGLGETEWANKIFELAETACNDYNSYQMLAGTLFKANEVDWAKKLFLKAENLAADYELVHFSKRINDTLDDKEWAKKILLKAEDKATSSSELDELSEIIREILDDTEWANKIISKNMGDEIDEDKDTCDSCGEYFFEEELKVRGQALHGDRVDWAFEENILEFPETVNLATIEFNFEEFDNTAKQDPKETESSEETFGLIKFLCPNCRKPYHLYCGEKGKIDRSFIPSNGFRTIEELITDKSKNGISMIGQKFNVKFCFFIDGNTFKHRGGEQTFECDGFEDAIEQLLNSDNIEIGVQGFNRYVHYYDIEILT